MSLCHMHASHSMTTAYGSSFSYDVPICCVVTVQLWELSMQCSPCMQRSSFVSLLERGRGTTNWKYAVLLPAIQVCWVQMRGYHCVRTMCSNTTGMSWQVLVCVRCWLASAVGRRMFALSAAASLSACSYGVGDLCS